MKTVFLLLVIYQIKHFLADYPLQGRYMLGKFKGGKDWILPLLAHVGVHGVFTLAIAYAFGCHYAPLLALLDMVLHFIMDRIKASPDMLGRFKALSAKEYPDVYRDSLAGYKSGNDTIMNPDGRRKEATAKLQGNVYFWWSLGLDQMVHHLTHYIIIYLILVTI